MKNIKHLLTIITLTLLLGCATTPEPEPGRTVAYKKHDVGYWIQYPSGPQWKPDAYFRKQIDQTRLMLANILIDLESASNSSRNGEMVDWMI